MKTPDSLQISLPLNEEFYTLQGEGQYAGKAAYFIRLAGCDIGCQWCDSKNTWNPSAFPTSPPGQIISRALKAGANTIIVTGGEPLLHDLSQLTRLAKQNQLQTFLETSGAYTLSGDWDWITLSPKKQKPPLSELYTAASELKVVISQKEDLQWAETNALKVSPACKLFLQAEWSKRETLTPLLVKYIKENPTWRLSVQTHKYLRIP